mgnify:CR=1 FL=1
MNLKEGRRWPMGAKLNMNGGEGIGGLLMGCVVVLALAMLGMRVFPIVKEKLEVDAIMESVAQNSGTGTTKEDLIARLLRQFEVADINHFTQSSLLTDLKVGAAPGRAGRMMMLSYDLKAPLFGGVYIGLNYAKAVRLPGDAE